MPRRRVNLIPEVKADIAQDAPFCAYQTAGIVMRIPDLQRNLRRFVAIVDLCEESESEEAQATKGRVDTLKQEITQGMSGTGRCRFTWPNTERLMASITQATRSGLYDMAYQVSKDLMAAVVNDLTSKEFVSEIEKELAAEAQAQAVSTMTEAQREQGLAVWREQVRKARVAKQPEPPMPAGLQQFYALEKKAEVTEAPRKRGRPKGTTSREPGTTAAAEAKQ